MKNSIENNFKQSLENFEMPYNADAWTALQSKLDAKAPVASKPKSNFRYYAAASALVVITAASYFIFRGDSVEKNIKETVAQSETVITGEANNEIKLDNSINESDNHINVVDANENANSNSNGNNINPLENNNNSNNNNVAENNEASNNENNNNSNNNSNNSNSNNENGLETQDQVASESYTIPRIADVCEGSTFKVKNTNNAPLLIEGPELDFIVPANSSRTIRTKGDGVHTIGLVNPVPDYPNNTFNVLSAPNADFSIDLDNKFEDGIPSTALEATVNGNNFEWYYNNVRSTGKEANAHFYKKGDHEITLTVTGVNGCKTSTTKSVYIEDKYNLMAVNSFVPTDNDPRNNTFMPFALTQRNVRFNMIIIDPTDGHTVFQTNDSSNGWNGTDALTGQQVAFEKSYIWKVVIENPATNEDNEYVGNIVPIHSRQ